MVTASLKGQVLAQSDNTVMVDGNHYFPPSSISKSFFEDSATHTTCPWKGEASYYTVRLPDGTVIPDAAWYYPETKAKANHIKAHIAFYGNKQIQIA
ncbi:MAG: hypothetical protein CYPHOPRED_002647 [Cyphobasidiales sp. Tagirdzhanova-0007]|nr:MAG: hypothetical protein CYPHOPRED_002647 [Cyphobasidiales sp. Tagirdzhanova-0007]